MKSKDDKITGIGRNPQKAIIQKARPLQSLAQSKLTLTEFKILDVYLARINSHEPEKRTVTFEKGELEHFLGVTRILKQDLNHRLQNLFQSVDIKDGDEWNHIHRIALFEEADARQDENGQWLITLTCTQAARRYIFNLENIGYLQYKLRAIINLTSRYSYIMFLYLERNRHWKTWTVSLEELKYELNCDADSYSAYKEFNDKILKRCQKELESKAGILFHYEPIRTGRKVTSVQFTVLTQSDMLENSSEEFEEQDIFNQMIDMDHEDAEEQALEKYGSEPLAFIAGACDYEFTQEEMRVIYDLVLQCVPGGDSLKQYDYLLRKYHVLKQYASKTEIKHRCNYLISLIKKDLES